MVDQVSTQVTSATISDVATTASTTTTPYGYTTAAQADAIPTAINSIIAALELEGIVPKV